MYQPDALAAFRVAGRTYVIVANEGDGRAYPALDEEVRVADLRLDPAAFPDAAELQRPAALGRLRVSNRCGDEDGDGDFDRLCALGARSVSIRDSSGGLLWDSGDLLERLTAAEPPAAPRAGPANGGSDERSDDKGPQPEGVAVGEVDGRLYAFIGLERTGGVVVFELSDPRAPVFQSHARPRHFAAGAVPARRADEGPEGLLFIPAADSPTGRPLLVVCNEVSGTTTVFAMDERPRTGTR
jgi:hypothetical protein